MKVMCDSMRARAIQCNTPTRILSQLNFREGYVCITFVSQQPFLMSTDIRLSRLL